MVAIAVVRIKMMLKVRLEIIMITVVIVNTIEIITAVVIKNQIIKAIRKKKTSQLNQTYLNSKLKLLKYLILTLIN